MTTDLLTKVRPLLDFIGKYESNGNYNVVWGGQVVITLTNMNINEVMRLMDSMLAEQRQRRGRAISTAVGKYQIIRKTLVSLVKTMNLTPETAIFDTNMQDSMALQLLIQRGLNSYLNGRMDAQTFAANLAMEWASMPMPNGKSYYDGDGVNSTKVSYQNYLWVVESIKMR